MNHNYDDSPSQSRQGCDRAIFQFLYSRFLDEQVAELADGSNIQLEIVGPLEVRFENRATTCRAMVLPGKAEILLGSIPMEDMDVLVNPREQRLIVNPESPYLAKKPLK